MSHEKGRRFTNTSIADYLREGTLVRIREHGREFLIAEVTKTYSAVHGTVEVHPLGWPFAVVLHASGIADVRMACPDGGAFSYAEFREIRKRQREAFEREHGTAPRTSEDEDDERKPERRPLLPPTPRGGCDE
ncbi:MAG: hypothetical protein KIS78_07895 [Labilithrix sp.]|nr:hypothetical protein [Labilithrix sp.]